MSGPTASEAVVLAVAAVGVGVGKALVTNIAMAIAKAIAMAAITAIATARLNTLNASSFDRSGMYSDMGPCHDVNSYYTGKRPNLPK